MTYDPPFWAIDPEVANFKEEGLVTPEEKKKFWKFDGSCSELNLGLLGDMPEC